MRLSISCDGCRKAKVKCIHEGHPPCRRCQRLNQQPCVLTDPRVSPLRPKKDSLRTQKKERSSSAAIENRPETTPDACSSHTCQCVPSNPIAALAPATIISACDTYRKKFPVANFLHYPSLIADISTNPSSVDPVFVASLLCLCARFMSGHNLEQEDVYAEYAREQLARRAFEGPSLHLAQSLVMISFYEWGSGRPYKAWMYSGMATYMIQSLLKTADDSMEHNLDDFQASQTQYEQLVRTYWCCFAQDCELSSGARQHFALSFRQISVPLPISDQDFNFCRRATSRLMPANMNRHALLSSDLTIDRGLTIVTRGFDIFVRILRFANESRRGQTASPAAPSAAHLTWRNLKEELDEWRALQDITVRYPETSAQAHVALGYGELFAYINLVYFMSILFLHRDCVLSGSKPYPDRPLNNVEETLWWDEVIDQLFEAAHNIGGVLSALEASETPVITPYAGFSVFVAAHINMYGTVSPLRYPGGRERAEQEKKANFLYLERLCEYWPVGHSWWRAVREADKFYQTAKCSQISDDRPSHLTLAGTLDEYGDIRSSRPRNDLSISMRKPEARMSEAVESANDERRSIRPPQASAQSSDHSTMDSHDLEAEMLQWPFIDETWFHGFDTNFDAAWPNVG